MQKFVISALLLLASLAPVYAQETDLITLETGQDSRGWEGVGRLDIGDTGFCTAALIRDRLILTAAHCVYGRDGRIIPASKFEFNAGLRSGRSEATRRVTRVVAHPDYEPRGGSSGTGNVAMDIAVLELDRAIRTTRIRPFPIAEHPRTGDEVGVVSYGRGRAEAPSLQEVCAVMGRQRGVIVMTCEVEFGSSGSPVFMVRDGVTSIASVVSAMAELGDQRVSLGTSLEEPLAELLAHFAIARPAKPGGTQRIISIRERNNTGAKFVSP